MATSRHTHPHTHTDTREKQTDTVHSNRLEAGLGTHHTGSDGPYPTPSRSVTSTASPRAAPTHPHPAPREPLGPLLICGQLGETWAAPAPGSRCSERRGGAGRTADGSSGGGGLGAGPAPIPAAAASVWAEAASPARGLEPGERGPRERGAALRWSSARRALGPGNHQVWTPRTPCAAEARAQPPPAALTDVDDGVGPHRHALAYPGEQPQRQRFHVPRARGSSARARGEAEGSAEREAPSGCSPGRPRESRPARVFSAPRPCAQQPEPSPAPRTRAPAPMVAAAAAARVQAGAAGAVSPALGRLRRRRGGGRGGSGTAACLTGRERTAEDAPSPPRPSAPPALPPSAPRPPRGHVTAEPPPRARRCPLAARRGSGAQLAALRTLGGRHRGRPPPPRNKGREKDRHLTSLGGPAAPGTPTAALECLGHPPSLGPRAPQTGSREPAESEGGAPSGHGDARESKGRASGACHLAERGPLARILARRSRRPSPAPRGPHSAARFGL